MMEFWPENQRQTHTYSRCGTIPGRPSAHNYHDMSQCLRYYAEQPGQRKESSDWTAPGSRMGGAQHHHLGWTQSEPSPENPSYFPFNIERRTQHPPDLRDQQHESMTSHRAARDCERGFLKEWPRRWESSNPQLTHDRNLPTKRRDSSYRELEAWAARYCHSLPRRRRLEAELRGDAQGLDRRCGTDPQIQPQYVQQRPNRPSGVWDRRVGQLPSTYYPSQAPELVRERNHRQSILYSRPPDYPAPPPYYTPRMSPPLSPHSGTSWEQGDKKRAEGSRSNLKGQDVYLDLQRETKVQKEEIVKSNESEIHVQFQKSYQEVSSQMSTSKLEMESKGFQAKRSSKASPELTAKVIEGRKFRLNQKNGGLTVFCLVARIAETSETPTVLVGTSQTNIQNTDISTAPNSGNEKNQNRELADEVDFSALLEQSDTSGFGDVAAKHTDNMVVQSDQSAETERNTAFLKESVQPAGAKYPLWREPCFLSSNCSTESSRQETSNEAGDNSTEEMGSEIKSLDIPEDTEEERALVTDTSCFVVKVELIPSPEKEHVHISGPGHSSRVLDKESLASPESDLSESEASSFSVQPDPPPQRETLKERAERILGIPLDGSNIEQRDDNKASLLDLSMEAQVEEAEAFLSEQSSEVLPKEDDSTSPCVVRDTKDEVKEEESEDNPEYQDKAEDLSKGSTKSQLEMENIRTETATIEDSLNDSLHEESKTDAEHETLPPDTDTPHEATCGNNSGLSLSSESNSAADSDPELVANPATPTFSSASTNSLLHFTSHPNTPETEAVDVKEVSDAEEDEEQVEPVNSLEDGSEREERLQSGDAARITDELQPEEVSKGQNSTDEQELLGISPQQQCCSQTEEVSCFHDEWNSPDKNKHVCDPEQMFETDESDGQTEDRRKQFDFGSDEAVFDSKEMVVGEQESQTEADFVADCPIHLKADDGQNVPFEALDSSSPSPSNQAAFPDPQTPPLINFQTDLVSLSDIKSDESSQNSNIPPTLHSVLSPRSNTSAACVKSFPCTAQKSELPCPRSLLDVVSRIRKHTAPDSESEEEEVTSTCSEGVSSEQTVSGEAEQQEALQDTATTGLVQKSEPESEEHTLCCISHIGDAVSAADKESPETEDEETDTNHQQQSEGGEKSPAESSDKEEDTDMCEETEAPHQEKRS